jgi:RNA 2',3'-cyclic 3'-phosphodiesterase
MPVKRIFIAIDISDEARAAVADYIDRFIIDFPRVKIAWERPEKLHFTIRFLGDIDEIKLANVGGMVETVANQFTLFSVRIVETGVFPHYKNPKVLWLGPKQGSEEMMKINAEIEYQLEHGGFTPEKRRFHPHLTIARIKDQEKSRTLVRVHRQRQFEPIVFNAAGIMVYESKLQRTGSEYFPVRFFPFNS